MSTNYIAPIWRMPRNANKDKLSNYSIEFNSSNTESITTSDNVGVSGSQSRTMCVWLKGGSANNSKGWPMAVAFGNGSTNQAMWIGGGGSPAAYWYFGFWGSPSATSGDLDSGVRMDADDNWHLLTSVYDESTQIAKGYIDGVEVVSGSRPSINTGSSPLIIGKHLTQTTYWDGPIAQVSIFDYALSTDQIGYIYNLNNPMVPGAVNLTAPIAYYPLGDNSNPNAPGSFPNISVGTDSVFDFNASEYIDVPDSDSLSFGNSVSDSPFSMSAWIKTTVGTAKGIISKWGSDGYEWIFWVVGPNKIRMNLNDGINTVYQTTQGSTSVNTGEWVHVVATYDGRGGDGSTGTNTANQGIKIYVNGVEDGPYSYLNGGGYVAMHNTPRRVQIGAYNSLGQFDGEISNAQIWGTELTAAEVTTLYNNGQALMTGTQPEEANLRAWWKLNQSASWEAITANTWQIPDNRSAYPQSFDFSKTAQEYIDLSKDDWFNEYNNEITFSVWVNKPNWSSTGFEGIISKYGTSGASIQYRIAYPSSASKLQFYLQGGPSGGPYSARIDTVTLTSAQTNPDWLHILWRHSASTNTSQVIFNGDHANAVSLTNIAANPYAQPQTTILNMIGNVSNGLQPFDGAISNYQRFNSYLDNAAVEALYNDGVPSTTAIASTNSQAWYKLNDNEKFDGTNWSIENQKYPANFDSALEFTKADTDTINYGVTSDWDNGDFSFGMWFFNDGQFGIPFTNAFDGAAVGFSINQYANGTTYIKRKTRATSGTDSGQLATSNSSYVDFGFEANKWQHIGISHNTSTNKMRVYANGQFHTEFNGSTHSSNTASTALFIGARSDTGGTSYAWEGELSNIQVFNSVLLDTDFQDMYNNGTPLIDMSSFTTLTHWWKLDNTITGIQDSKGSLNGTNNGTTKVNTFVSTEAVKSSTLTEQSLVNNNVSELNGDSVGMDTNSLVQSNLTRTQPYSNYSINFDANSIDYIQVANPGNIIGYGESAYTFSGWVNFDVIGNQDGIFGRYQDSSNRVTIKTGITSPYNGIVLQIQNGSSNGYSEWQNIITTGQWYHICGVYDGSQGTQSNRLKLYLNGVDQGARNNGSGTIPATTTNMTASTPLDIGNDRRITGRVLDGKVSNYCVFDRILTDAEILKIYNNGITQDLQATSSFSNNILAWWPMDANNSYYDGTNWTVRDLQGGKDGNGINTGNVVGDMTGTAPGSEGSGLGVNLAIEDLKGNMYNSDKNAYSINMADYADGVTNPANSGRSTDTP